MITCIVLCKRFLVWMMRALNITPLQGDHAHPTLLPGKTLVFQAEVAAEFGVNGAIILQKVHEWLVYNERKKKALHMVSGRWWAFNSYKQWQESHFTWLSETTVKREFGKLRKRGVLLAGSFGKRGDRRLWSSIDYDRLRAILTPGLAEGVEVKPPSGQIDPMPVQLGLMVGSSWPATSIKSQKESQENKSKEVIEEPDGEEILNEIGKRECGQWIEEDTRADIRDETPTPALPRIQGREKDNTVIPEWGTPEAAWQVAYVQLELQFDRATFDTWLRDMTLVRVEGWQGAEAPLFVVGAQNVLQRDMLEHRLCRNVRRVLSDCASRDVTLKFEMQSASVN